VTGLRVWRIPYSTNVERVALVLAHKGLEVEWVDVDPGDRSAVIALSGQALVPILQTADGTVIADSTAIVDWLDEQVPEPALYPADPTGRAQAEIAIDWFNRVWKVAPNAIAAERATPAPDAERLSRLGAELRGGLPRFEALLSGRPFLLGDELGAFDLCAFPFLKYGTLPVAADDPDDFHRVLAEQLVLDGAFPRLADWIARVDAQPRA
jgi:RNA polymerase-associated protein